MANRKGRVTIPTDLDVVPQTKEIMERWGADALRDCDGTEFPRTDEYNYALGLKRANSVKAGYVAKGVAEAGISTVSYGEGNPVCKESTEECWAKNRRVDTKLEK
jgi:hypothetical protein